MDLMARTLVFFFKVLVLILCFVGLSQGGKQWGAQTPEGLPPLLDATDFPELEQAAAAAAYGGGYDYIVVGGGAAGCPLAATLSRGVGGSRVLVLERGGSPYGNRNISLLDNFHISLADRSPGAPAQPFLTTDGVINTRARVLGGGTCINAGFYTRASTSFVQEAGWDAELVNQSYPWIEEKIVHWPNLSPWQAALRDGLLAAGVSPYNGYTYDHLIGTKIGGSTFDENGYRHTAADLLAAGSFINLRVLLHASVDKIIFGTSPGLQNRPRAIGVQFRDKNGGIHKAFLTQKKGSEVILSAGAIGSPQLLLLSGVGPRDELDKHNISVILDNEHVGKGIVDNPQNSIFVPTKDPPKKSLIQTVGITGGGVFIEASSGFSQKPDSIRCEQRVMTSELPPVPSKQRNLGAVDEYENNKGCIPKEVFNGGFIISKVDRPLSTGELVLVDTNSNNNPKVTFNYFQDPQDLSRCVYGIKTIERILNTSHFSKFTPNGVGYPMETMLNMSVSENINLRPKQPNDTTSLEQFCIDTVTTIWHYHGGCHVGKVVDEQYRVIGISDLRVIDGSTFFQSPGTNPQATVMMLGRYMGVKIMRERFGDELNIDLGSM